ncbi:BTAD domain-containing putative transcriptional regulator [Streptomyces bacillaris]|uniref:BTAD domain-containing putative transcriptional regulator n=1 Tax=Streptomyces bacillaris TaxID=68179 RepID=UPI00365903EF
MSAPRQRVVMAALLLNANRVISVDRITEYVWDGAPPPSAAATVRTYMMRLRQSLGEHASARILTRAPGYLLELGEHESDLGQFTAHRRRAAELAERGDLEGSSAALAEALALWREEPLADIPWRTLRDVEGRYLQELRLQTMELRFDAELALLRHAEIVPELVRLVREHPLREALVGKLMLALFRSGRQSEALGLYRRTRVLLVEQLGAEPGADLREVHRHILSAHDRPRTPDPQERPAPAPETAAAPAAATVRERSRWPDPAQLPSVPLPLSARSDALADIPERSFARLEERLLKRLGIASPVGATSPDSRPAPVPRTRDRQQPPVARRAVTGRATPSSAVHKKVKILMVDDQPESLLAQEAVLSPLEHTVVRASSGQEALSALNEDEFAVVLLAAQMSGMDGYETAAHIKRLSPPRDIPITFVSNREMNSHATCRAYAAGAVDLVSRPYNSWVLRGKVTAFVDLHKVNMQLREQEAWLRVEELTLLRQLSAHFVDAERQAHDLTGRLQGASPEVRATASRLEHALSELRQVLHGVLDPQDD